MKALNFDKTLLQTRIIEINKALRIVRGYVSVEGGGLAAVSLVFVLMVRLGSRLYRVGVPAASSYHFKGNRVVDAKGRENSFRFNIAGATHLRFKGRVKITPIVRDPNEQKLLKHGEIVLCPYTRVQFHKNQRPIQTPILDDKNLEDTE